MPILNEANLYRVTNIFTTGAHTPSNVHVLNSHNAEKPLKCCN